MNKVKHNSLLSSNKWYKVSEDTEKPGTGTCEVNKNVNKMNLRKSHEA